MARRKVAPKPRFPAGWEVHSEIKLPGLARLEKGREFTARGLGRLIFCQYVVADSGEWIDGWSPDRGYRSVAIERIRAVHRKTKLRASARERIMT